MKKDILTKPKKIIKHGGGFLENDNDVFYQCPTCLSYIGNITKYKKKCESCGQFLTK